MPRYRISCTDFGQIAKEQLTQSSLLHADETGININGKSAWLHNLSNQYWTLMTPHEKRGAKAIEEIGIMPSYRGHLYMIIKKC